MTATHSGSFHGIPASGKRVTITYMDFAVIQQGKIIEEWAEFDIQAILNQLKPS
jgi:predicted ester cyclase